MSSGLIREAGMQIRKQKFKKVEAGKKIARRECSPICIIQLGRSLQYI